MFPIRLERRATKKRDDLTTLISNLGAVVRQPA
jgi:hypothetical protein